MKKPIIIGFGNPLRQDDGIGWRAIDLLRSRLPNDAAELVQCHQLLPELVPCLQDASLVLFLDAAADIRPGEVVCSYVRPRSCGDYSHRLEPAQLMGLAEVTNRSAPPALLIRGGAMWLGCGEGLSDFGAECAQEMANLAAKLAIAGAVEDPPTVLQ